MRVGHEDLKTSLTKTKGFSFATHYAPAKWFCQEIKECGLGAASIMRRDRCGLANGLNQSQDRP
jgi:hypothetical protein